MFQRSADVIGKPNGPASQPGLRLEIWILGNDIAARDTWPWVLTRETTAWLTGLDEYQQLELAEQLELPGNGPLCCLVTAQLLDYQGGYVFFTTGDGFRVSPSIAIVDYASGKPAGTPQPREYARVTFDPAGTKRGSTAIVR